MSRVDPPGSRFSALVVDDDPSVQGLFLTLLGKCGFAVDTAFNGRDAYECIRRASYSVILLDLMMPDVNGLELIERLGREGGSLLDRVIVVTGAAQGDVDAIDGSRVWGVIRKPFDIDQMIESARACAEGRRATAVMSPES